MSGGPYQAITWGRERDHAGVTDLAVLYGLYMIWFEVKQPGEPHRDSQKKFATEIAGLGGIVIVLRTMDDLERAIEMIRREFGGG
jgi:hypothetical protein